MTTAREKISNDKYDFESWKIILDNMDNKDLSECQDTYEECVKIFPTSSYCWINYYKKAERSKNYELMGNILQRCNEICYNIEIWKYYLKYVIEHVCKDENNDSKNMKIIEAYEYALNFIGMDIDSSPMWLDYLKFLKSLESNEIQAKIVEVYSRVLSQPIHNIDVIQKEYLEYKKNIRTSTNTINESSFEDTLKVLNERSKLMSNITFSQFPRPPKGLNDEIENIKNWKILLEFEKSNPQNLDSEQLNQRILFTFNKSLSQLLFYPEFWHMLATFKSKIGGVDDAIQGLYFLFFYVL